MIEDTNGQVRRRGLERILVAATLAAVAMLGCSADHGGILLPTAPSAVNAPTTASSASAVATSTSTGAEAASSGSQITVDSSMMSTRRLNAATTDGVLTANFLFLSDHDGSSFVGELHFSEPIVDKASYLSDDAFSVTGGSITKARRRNRQARSDGGWMAHQWKLWVTPSGSGDVVITAPGGRSCAENGALCTEAGQSLSHALSMTIRGPGDESDPDTGQQSQQSQQSGSDLPGPPRDLRVVYWGSANYHVSWRGASDRSGRSASEYRVRVGGCGNISRITVDASWSNTYKMVVNAGSRGTTMFGVEGVNRNGTGPCMEVAPVVQRPDLVVRSPSVNPSSLETGQAFTLSVTVGNDGDGNAPWKPTLVYYRSTSQTITHDDTEEDGGRTENEKLIGALFAGDTRSHSINLTAPSAAGTYYYGACLALTAETNEFESDNTNNCSESVAVVVSD